MLAAVADEGDSQFEALGKEFSDQSIGEALATLQEANVLTTDAKPGLSDDWSDWGDATWFFHLATKDTRFAVTVEDQMAVAADVVLEPPPPHIKCRCGTGATVELPAPRPLPPDSLSQILLRRRTCRDFSGSPIDLADVADVLFYSAGILFEHSTTVYGTVVKKASPSPGARHPTELYPVLSACADADPGIYHYCARHHRLARLSDVSQPFLEDALLWQRYFSNASFFVFFTCVVERLMWKYKAPRIYKLAHLEAGHCCQNLLLAATALGLGAFCTGALRDSAIEEALGVEGAKEFVIYAAGAGPARQARSYRRPDVVVAEHLPHAVTIAESL